MVSGERPANVLALPRWTIIIHGVQVLFAIIILGLDAYGIRYIAYNALIFSLVTCILTLGICAYIVGTSLFLHKLYNMYIVLGLHVLMVIFWIVVLGLVANLARIWSLAGDSSYGYCYGTYCYYGKRDLDLTKRETTTIKSYYGALAAGAFFSAVQFATWVLSGVFVLIYMNKHRSSSTTVHNPPSYNGNEQGVPMVQQKYTQSTEQPYSAAQTSQPQYAQPQGQFSQQPVYNHQQPYGQYPQDPVNREQTVSPVSQVGYVPPQQNTPEMPTPQHTGAYQAPSSASELGTPQHPGGYNPNMHELANQK